MRILFTGGSSFTGYWFIKELAAAGHEVVGTFQRPDAAAYAGSVAGQRVAKLASLCRPVFSCSFGDETFSKLVREAGPWDVLCHHAADVTNYKSPDFDVAAAVQKNTRNLRAVLTDLGAGQCRRIVLTGSVFEGGEGAGSEGLPHFSPYGLSKALTAEAFRYYAAVAGMRLGKFVIPNPFGPFEEPRFTAFLVRQWAEKKKPAVNTPAYVRDNIHVSLLAKAYRQFVASLPGEPGFTKINPSGYVETQGAFALRFAAEMSPRLGLECPVELKRQTEFSEPRVRVNTDVLSSDALGWNETAAWDEMAAYYRASAAGT
ncbi:MAG: NAD(P)-dependent oxidoreductase [Phycisphaeraceae bacterium]|nr:NAD(P)-dependent oxidoreductase [Phycisphaeraceae bacterium]